MQTGSFGSIIFEASSERIRTWDGFQQTHRADFAEHEVIDAPERLEFTGRKGRELGLEVLLNIRFLDVQAEIEAFREILETGEPQVLIIGGVPLGDYVLTEVQEGRNHADGHGRPISARLRLKLREYH